MGFNGQHIREPTSLRAVSLEPTLTVSIVGGEEDVDAWQAALPQGNRPG